MVISPPSAIRQKEAQQADTMRAHVAKIKAWLKHNDDKPGKSGGTKKSNITDNDNAKDRTQAVKQSYTTKMKQKIDTPEGRQQHSRRLGIVEPVFGHITISIGLKRFSLRGWVKVNIQWKLFCIVHNLICARKL